MPAWREKIMETIVNDNYIILEGLLNSETRRQAFSQLLAKYQQDVYFFLRHLVLDHEETDELVQDVFLKIYNQAKTLDIKDDLEQIVYGLAAQACQLYFKLQPQERWLPNLIAYLKLHTFSFKDVAAILHLPLQTVKDAYHTWLTKQTTTLNA